MPTLWKVTCPEHWWPGLWKRWYRNQCVAVGWPPPAYSLFAGQGDESQGWVRARNALGAVEVGDVVAVTLQGHRVGRLGEVVAKKLDDTDWDPLVPPDPTIPYGEMGRRLLVRWDLAAVPDSPDEVVKLPAARTFSPGELRNTVAAVSTYSVEELREAMSDPVNRVGTAGRFRYERSLSDFVAAYPHRLEDGMLPFPNAKIRELTFDDGSRLDVLLVDRDNIPVVVECKQDSPGLEALEQLKHYMARVAEQRPGPVRGLLLHGGPRVLSAEMRAALATEPDIDVVQYRLDVAFAKCEYGPDGEAVATVSGRTDSPLGKGCPQKRDSFRLSGLDILSAFTILPRSSSPQR